MQPVKKENSLHSTRDLSFLLNEVRSSQVYGANTNLPAVCSVRTTTLALCTCNLTTVPFDRWSLVTD